MAIDALHELARSRSHGSGMALYYLTRLLWHWLGWWSLAVTGAAGAGLAWLRHQAGR